VFRFPTPDGHQLDPRRGLLSLAVAGRRDYQQQQVWQHAQKIHGGLDVLAGVTNAEQGAGLSGLWRPLGTMLAALPQADVIADCGRIGADGPPYDLLAEADTVLLVTRPDLGDVIRLRDRAAAVAAAMDRRGRRGFAVDVLVVADPAQLKNAEAEVAHALVQAGVPLRRTAGLARDAKGAGLLGGTWGGKLDRTLLMRTAREVAGDLAAKEPASSPVHEPAPVPRAGRHGQRAAGQAMADWVTGPQPSGAAGAAVQPDGLGGR
jgi:hypothetical protein